MQCKTSTIFAAWGGLILCFAAIITVGLFAPLILPAVSTGTALLLAAGLLLVRLFSA